MVSNLTGTHWPRAIVLTWLKDHVPPPRLQHILRVEVMASTLAQKHDLDPKKAAQAGLMHDLAKYFQPEQLLQWAKTHQLPLDPVDIANPHLLHAPVSALVAQAEFGICDPEILAAIRDHTLGQPQMSLLSCVVFLADSLEPGRGNRPELNEAREISQQDLYHGVAIACDLTLQHLLKTQQLIHPRMVLTRNWAWLQIQS
ncbi:MAG: HD domain-containing protein [Acaryochloris sp. SU_5_25]|nr:HD domain-containing protein [Acaryochloris sp. SU_5_25]